MSQKKFDIYLSYSHQDHTWVSQFVHALTDAGLCVSFDPADILPGERWQERMADALRQSNILIVILSKSSVNSPWMFFEIGAAVAGDKFIIPLLIDDTDMLEVPMPIAQFQILRENVPSVAASSIAGVLGKMAKG